MVEPGPVHLQALRHREGNYPWGRNILSLFSGLMMGGLALLQYVVRFHTRAKMGIK